MAGGIQVGDSDTAVFDNQLEMMFQGSAAGLVAASMAPSGSNAGMLGLENKVDGSSGSKGKPKAKAAPATPAPSANVDVLQQMFQVPQCPVVQPPCQLPASGALPQDAAGTYVGRLYSSCLSMQSLCSATYFCSRTT